MEDNEDQKVFGYPHSSKHLQKKETCTSPEQVKGERWQKQLYVYKHANPVKIFFKHLICMQLFVNEAHRE